MNFARYIQVSGEILQMLSGDMDDAKRMLGSGEALLDDPGDINDLTHYIDTSGATPTPQPRTQTTCTASATTVAADGTSTITLSGLADNTQIDITGPVNSSFVNTAASEDLTFGAAGFYTITATAPFPALPTTVTISAT